MTTRQSAGEPHWVTVPCFMCTNECGIRVALSEGRVVDVEGWAGHPHSQGHICVKARQIPEFVYHDARIKHPLRKTDRGWQRFSWDDALDTIAHTLQEGKERYGAGSLGLMTGEPVEVTAELGIGLVSRFADVYGTVHRFTDGCMCYFPVIFAQRTTFGKGAGYEPDVENAGCIVVWADNPRDTAPAVHHKILKARRRGAKLVVVDPRSTSLAKVADVHLRPRPGTDGMLLLAVINVIIAEKLYDEEFVGNWTVGFDRLAEHVKAFTVEEAERVSGVPAEQIRQLARVYAGSRPACIQCGFKLHQCQCGFQNCRSVAVLQAITGNLQVRGGELEHFFFRPRSARLRGLLGDTKHPNAEKYPVYPYFPFSDEPMPDWGDLILNEPRQLRNMIVAASNPAITWPNSAKVRRALGKLDFLVVMDVLMTPTAELADIVLPACTFLEKGVALNSWRGYFLRRPVIQPQWESWPDWRFWMELARRMGYEQYFPWQNDEEAFDYFYGISGLTVKGICEASGTAFIRPHVNPGEQQYRQTGFRTPSGKVELYSSLLEAMGHDPLPTYSEPRHSPISTPDLFKQYPLQLTTGTREVEYYHSEHRHLGKLQQRNPGPRAQIHPHTAAQYGISDGGPMVIETPTGHLEIAAHVTDTIVPGMISVPHGWAQAPENMLTNDASADPVTGYPALTGLLCRVKAAQSG